MVDFLVEKGSAQRAAARIPKGINRSVSSRAAASAVRPVQSQNKTLGVFFMPRSILMFPGLKITTKVKNNQKPD